MTKLSQYDMALTVILKQLLHSGLVILKVEAFQNFTKQEPVRTG